MEKITLLTEDILKASSQFKEWINGTVHLIHNCYYDSKEPYGSFIVVHSINDKYFTITRFFLMGGKIQVSQDYVEVSMNKVFQLLLSDYSRGLN